MELKISNNVLSIGTLQEKMDTIVFEYIDTAQNWQVAYKRLNVLLQETMSYVNQYWESNSRELPKANTYWNLLMNTTSQLVYFTTLAKSHVDVDEKNLASYRAAFESAVNIMPNITAEDNEALLDEIDRSNKELGGQAIERVPRNWERCFNALIAFAKQYA